MDRPEPPTPAPSPPGAPDEFDRFFRAHYAPLVRAMTVICGRRETAEDCVQEAFARAHVRWTRIRRYDEPAAWVRRVAINRARDEGRRAARAERLTERLAQDPVAGGPAAPAGVFDDGDGRLDQLVAGLPPRQREVLALFYVERATIAQIALGVGISEGAVKFHLSQARSRLRGELGTTREGGT